MSGTEPPRAQGARCRNPMCVFFGISYIELVALRRGSEQFDIALQSRILPTDLHAVNLGPSRTRYLQADRDHIATVPFSSPNYLAVGLIYDACLNPGRRGLRFGAHP